MIPRTPIIDDDGTGTTGTVIDNAWKTELYNQIDADPPWITVPHVAADFFNADVSWYVPTAGRKYCLKGKQVTIAVVVKNSQNFVASYLLGIRGWPFTLKVDTLTDVAYQPALSTYGVAGGVSGVLCAVSPDGTYLDFRRSNFSNWPVTGADLSLSVTFTAEIV